MKMLFYRYGSICEPDILSAFAELGVETTEYTDEITNKDRPLKTATKLLGNFLLDHPVDFVFSINFFPFISELCNIFHIRYLCWTVDSPVMELYSTAISNEWNRIFLFDREQYNEFIEYNPERIFHLPLAASVKNKIRLFEATPQDIQKNYAHDIAFVGSLYSEKCPYDRLADNHSYLNGYLNAIMAAQESVYGYYFISDLLTDKIIAQFRDNFPGFYEYPGVSHLSPRETLSQLYIGNKISALERLHTFQFLCQAHSVDIYTGSDTSSIPSIIDHGLAKSLTEMPLIFHNSKINLNITSKPIRSGLPLRIFDIISCGGFVLSNYQTELPELFNIDSEIVTYGSYDELLAQCDYYLTHDKIRAEIAESAYHKLCKQHTYELRLVNMLELAYSI